jgi:predicted enzyme related to lactoylglutathione lyase
MTMGRPVVHWEFMSKDPGGVSDFYAKIFDWKIQPPMPGMGTLSLFTDPEGRMNGLWKAAGMPAKKPARKAAGKLARKPARKKRK